MIDQYFSNDPSLHERRARQASFDFSRNSALWEVDDSFIESPLKKFTKTSSPFIEVTLESWGQTQFENVKSCPKAMLEFVDRFVGSLGILPSKYSSIRDVCHNVLRSIDYEEPYFFLVDMLVQLSHEEFKHTYRHKRTGDVLDPAKIEVFELCPQWDFKPYHAVRQILEHPETRRFLTSKYVPPRFSSHEDALYALLSRISDCVWGKIDWMDHTLDHIIESHIETLRCDKYPSPELDYEITSLVGEDRLFWLAGALGLITWLKGPAAVPFITEYHVVYHQLLNINDDGTVSPCTESGGKVIVDMTDVYTLDQLECVPNRRPDTCSCCGEALHCTKNLNVVALQHPVCSCGVTIDPTDVEFAYSKHHGRDCRAHQEACPPRTGFVCQRCIFMTVNRLGSETKCGRTICPAVSCPHHMGNAFRIRALTDQRTKQLTSSRPS